MRISTKFWPIIPRSACISCRKGKFLFVNTRILDYSGYVEEELLALNSTDIIHPQDRAMVAKQASRMLKGQRFSPYEFRVITRDGRVKWIMETITSISFRGSQAILGNSMDITEQKGSAQTP